MTTATLERNALHQTIDTLSDEAITRLVPYVISLQREYEDAELTGAAGTRAAIDELRSGKGERVTIEQLMAELNA
ncbi:hypothetical protein FACS1894204_10080 [Synergistales bacterium]|nr:hypothetical protein FACS1894204_10080 [Synergistales bacterium]